MLIPRILSALVLLPVALAAIWYGGAFFTALVAVAAALMAWEWNRMVDSRVAPRLYLFGMPYIAVPSAALVWLRPLPDGFQTVLWLLCLVWATDIGAYAAGRTIGGPKLMPRVSPKKTWAGLIGGVVSAAAVGAGVAAWLGLSALGFAVVSGGLAVVSQAGDLFESWVKRRFDVKDSSNIIPGHGGVLDRVDGVLPVAVVVAALAWVQGGGILTWRL
jgi:phosphatidate cytidylyltransferase